MDKDLIYDVGAHNGDDSAYYLSLCYKVIAIEADPILAEALNKRFANEVSEGRYKVLNVGIAEHNGELPFYVSKNSIWNSFNKEMASREGGTCNEIIITCQTFKSILKEHGVPYFLKVDIEGSDHLCLLGLNSDDLPKFVSFEVNDNPSTLVHHLDNLGYTNYRFVNQQDWSILTIPALGTSQHIVWSLRQWLRLALRRHPFIHNPLTKFKRVWNKGTKSTHSTIESTKPGWTFKSGCSGPIPSLVNEDWSDMESFYYLLHSARLAGISESSWFDIHAKL